MISSEALNIRLSFKMETVSPVAIGDGGRLSPLTDYVWLSDSEEIVLIDHKVFERRLYENEHLMDKFVRGVYQVHDKNKQYFLRDFIETVLNASVEDFMKGDFFPVSEMKSPKEINTILKEAGKPYLPGTTLKGAIKTALLYDWMLKQPESKLAPAAHLKNMIRHLNPKKDKVQTAYNEIEDKLFGDIKKDERMDFSLIKVRDAEQFSQSSVIICNTERYHIRPGENTDKPNTRKTHVPIITEAIETGSSSNFEILIANNHSEKLQNDFLQFFLAENPAQELLRLLNQFALAFIQNENKAISKMKEEVQKDLKYYLRFLEVIKTDIEKGDNKEAYLRLGKGKTYFNNSIGLSINKDKEAFESLRWMFAPEMGKRGQKVFPITRQLILPDYMPLGWVKLKSKTIDN
jgi:CRISPR-associated protein Csm5